MQFSLNDIPAHLQKCGIPMTYKIIHLWSLGLVVIIHNK
jgi:hypothetical protein